MARCNSRIFLPSHGARLPTADGEEEESCAGSSCAGSSVPLQYRHKKRGFVRVELQRDDRGYTDEEAAPRPVTGSWCGRAVVLIAGLFMMAVAFALLGALMSDSDQPMLPQRADLLQAAPPSQPPPQPLPPPPPPPPQMLPPPCPPSRPPSRPPSGPPLARPAATTEQADASALESFYEALHRSSYAAVLYRGPQHLSATAGADQTAAGALDAPPEALDPLPPLQRLKMIWLELLDNQTLLLLSHVRLCELDDTRISATVYFRHSWQFSPADAAWLHQPQTHAVPSHSWAEVVHCPGSGIADGTWFYVAAGSGRSINVGKTLVLANHSAYRQGGAAFMSTVLSAGYNSVQFLSHLAPGDTDSESIEEARHELVMLDAPPHLIRCGPSSALRACTADEPAVALASRCAAHFPGEVLRSPRLRLLIPHRTEAQLATAHTGGPSGDSDPPRYIDYQAAGRAAWYAAQDAWVGSWGRGPPLPASGPERTEAFAEAKVRRRHAVLAKVLCAVRGT